jgi:hypothetical protein
MPLMHSYITYLNGLRRSVERYTAGRLEEQDLKSIWEAPG